MMNIMTAIQLGVCETAELRPPLTCWFTERDKRVDEEAPTKGAYEEIPMQKGVKTPFEPQLC